MADSAFWRDLATQFRELPAACQMLRADRYYIINTGGVGRWTLVGTISDQVRFEALARRAGAELSNPVSHDLLIAWLEGVMAQGDSGFKFNPIATEINADGTDGPQYMTGSMSNLPEASANFCAMQESWALQAEYEKNRPNDPRNWSQLRQQYEAFRSLRELRSEPPDRIPEEFVRQAIARIRNIKPEDVTREQIAFEVAGLLSSTRRHIELIPSTNTGSPPSEQETNPGYVGIDKNRKDNVPESAPQSTTPNETIAAQLQRLRDECRWSIPELAEAADLSSRQVARHLSGEFQPLARNISAYERAFSKHLQRKVVIQKMS